MAIENRFGNSTDAFSTALSNIKNTLYNQLDPIQKEKQKEDFRNRYNAIMMSGKATGNNIGKQTGLLSTSGDRVSDATAIKGASGSQELGYNQDKQDIGNLMTAGSLENSIGGSQGKLNLADESITNNADLFNRTLKSRLQQILNNRTYANQVATKNLQNDLDITKLQADLAMRNEPSALQRVGSGVSGGLFDIIGKYLSST